MWSFLCNPIDISGTSFSLILTSVNDCIVIIWGRLVAYIFSFNFFAYQGSLGSACMHKTLMCLLQAVDFLDNLLQYDHQERLTAREAMVEHLLASVCIHLPTQSLAVVVNFAGPPIFLPCTSNGDQCPPHCLREAHKYVSMLRRHLPPTQLVSYMQ